MPDKEIHLTKNQSLEEIQDQYSECLQCEVWKSQSLDHMFAYTLVQNRLRILIQNQHSQIQF
jgi:hypothetical protein